MAVAFVAVLTLMLAIPLPDGGRGFGALSDLLHGPFFAVLAVLVLRVLRAWLPRHDVPTMVTTWILVAGFGLATEVMQGLVGRDPSWQDVWADALGATAGTLWAAGIAATRATRVCISVVCSLLLVVAAARPSLVLADICLQRFQMPQLATFEHPLELSRWVGRECRVTRVRCHATEGSWALRVDLQPGKYPGITLRDPPPDWSSYVQLVFDVELDDGPPLDLVVKIEDIEHDGEYYDRFHQKVRLSPGRHQVQVALTDVAAAPRGREMDLRGIASLQLFTVQLDCPRTIHLDHVRLR